MTYSTKPKDFLVFARKRGNIKTSQCDTGSISIAQLFLKVQETPAEYFQISRQANSSIFCTLPLLLGVLGNNTYEDSKIDSPLLSK